MISENRLQHTFTRFLLDHLLCHLLYLFGDRIGSNSLNLLRHAKKKKNCSAPKRTCQLRMTNKIILRFNFFSSQRIGYHSAPQRTMSIGIPIKLLHEAEGHTVTIETLAGEVYRGHLAESEDNMNCHLQNATLTGRDGKQTPLEHAFIRGSKIRFFIIPDMLKNAPMFKLAEAVKAGTPFARGRGMPMGRAAAMARGFSRGGRGGPRGGRGGPRGAPQPPKVM